MKVPGVAKRRDVSTWIDRSGNICDDSEAFRCKVTHDLIHSEMCVVGDKVGDNLNMSGGGYFGGGAVIV